MDRIEPVEKIKPIAIAPVTNIQRSTYRLKRMPAVDEATVKMIRRNMIEDIEVIKNR